MPRKPPKNPPNLRLVGAAPLSDTSTPGTEMPMASTPSAPPASIGRKTKTRSAIIPGLGLTEKQEAFCQGVTAGLNLSDAYRQAYVTDNMTEPTLHRLACVLFADPKIRSRLMAINAEMESNRRMMAASDAALALMVLRKMAASADSDATKVRAAELLAKAGGVFVEQLDITDKRERSEDEIEQAIAAKLSRLGLTG